jgi:hypothetical protein
MKFRLVFLEFSYYNGIDWRCAMKKILFAALVLTAIASIQPLFAQKISEKNQSDMYYVNVPLEKIYQYRLGYILTYRKGVNQLAQVYVPNEWFTDAAGQAELIKLPPGKNWPSLSLYYKSGEFSHLKLYIHRSRAHDTWGAVPLNVNIDDRFENLGEIKIEF